VAGRQLGPLAVYLQVSRGMLQCGGSERGVQVRELAGVAIHQGTGLVWLAGGE
jgi:hypothetical protein